MLRRPSWWERRAWLACLFWPLAMIFAACSALRRFGYARGWLHSERMSVPVIVVGNIAAGGSGKTPAVLWLVEKLRAHGFRPGIVSRGYGGRLVGPAEVRKTSDPRDVGDEPVLLARRSDVPVLIGRDRVAACRALLAAHPDVNVIVTDDGLQHYRLQRDIEIVVVDPVLLGNRWWLPAGPLREGLSRLGLATLVLAHGEGQIDAGRTPAFRMQLAPGSWYRLSDAGQTSTPQALAALRTRAIAGIGHPERFFATVRAQGIFPRECVALPDHHTPSAADLRLADADALLMTEKDAIKCAALAPVEAWVLPVRAVIDEAAWCCVLERLDGSKTA